MHKYATIILQIHNYCTFTYDTTIFTQKSEVLLGRTPIRAHFTSNNYQKSHDCCTQMQDSCTITGIMH